MNRAESGLHVDTKPHDALLRGITRRLPRLAARAMIRVHRQLIGQRLKAIAIADGVQMAVSPQDNLGHHLYYYGSYEPEQGRLWAELLSRGTELVVLDVGANMGYYSLLAAARSNVARVISFEPNPAVLPVLRYNLAANPALAGKLTAVEAAAGDIEGEVPFHRNHAEHNFGLGSLQARNEDDVTVKVPLVRLDRKLPEMGVHRVDLVKVDVEGAELAVLRGLLGWSRPTLVVEVHPPLLPAFGASASDVLALLKQANYRIRRLRDDGTLINADSLGEIAWVLAEPM